MNKQMTFIKALIPVSTMTILILFSVLIWHVPIHLAIFFELSITVALAFYWNYSWSEIEEMLFSSFKDVGSVIIILILIGMLIGIWIASGTVPTMIYFGLKIIRPRYFLVLTFLITSIVSMAIGTAFGTASTIGLALISIAQGLGLPLPLVAGAIISGSYVGDRMSPVSSITNITAHSAGVDINELIKHMIYLLIVPYIISFFLYLIIGYKYLPSELDVSQVKILTMVLENNYTISFWLLIPPLLIIILAALKMPTLPNLAISIFTSIFLGIIISGKSIILLINSLYSGYVSQTGVIVVDKLLSRGGLTSMLELISLIIFAVLLGGLFEELGILKSILNSLVRVIYNHSQLILITMGSSIITAMLGCNQLFAVFLPGRMMSGKYDDLNVPRKELGRALGDSGLILSPMIPWNVNALLMTGVLGIGVFEYFPYAFLNLLLPFSSIILSLFNISSVSGISPIVNNKGENIEK